MNLYTPLIRQAMRLAYDAHHGQTDDDGMPYIYHPVAVAEQMRTEEEIITALLHDVIEDTAVTHDELAAMGFPPAVLEAVRLLTHAKGEPYMDYLRRIKPNQLARKVKLADIKHNARDDRLEDRGIPSGRAERLRKKYETAREFLIRQDHLEDSELTLARLEREAEAVPSYQIKRHVYKTQRYYPDDRTQVYEYDEYCTLRTGAMLLKSNMLQVTVNAVTRRWDGAGWNAAPGVELFIKQNVWNHDGEKEWLYGQRVALKTLEPGEVVHVDDAGLNCSDYFVQYSFDFSIMEGDYDADSH